MNMINLEDAKVSYESQTLPAIDLIGKLRTQLREAASRMAAIAETLGDLFPKASTTRSNGYPAWHTASRMSITSCSRSISIAECLTHGTQLKHERWKIVLVKTKL